MSDDEFKGSIEYHTAIHIYNHVPSNLAKSLCHSSDKGHPAAANIARRACFISASRIRTIRPSLDKPKGSNPTSPAKVPSKDSGESNIGNHFAIRGFFRLSGVTYMDEISDLGVNALAALSDANESKSISKSPLVDDVTGLSEANVETALSVGLVSDICRRVFRRIPLVVNAVAVETAETTINNKRQLVIVRTQN